MSDSNINPQIEASWKEALAAEFQQPYFSAIKTFLLREKAEGRRIFPPGPLIFNAFNRTPFDSLRVVILGQDPYINAGEAMGLSFSVPQGVRTPPSLVNIYKEINRDLGLPMPAHGDLTRWAEQGVLLLNASLTVRAGASNSHKDCGWQTFTDAVIRKISSEKTGVVFMLWGNFARGKKVLIDPAKHLILEAAHPSPLAGNAFSGCAHFSKANDFLLKNGHPAIDWRA